ncbi:MAG: GreA/GreB family elongation factor [Bacillota bacterium]
MRGRPIVLTDTDVRRLRDEIRVARSSWATYTPAVDILEARLRRAQIVAPVAALRDTVTMNSRFQVRDLRSDETETLTLVYPLEADHQQQKVSVLSPAGLAALGAQVGDFIAWSDADESRSARIEGLLYQPEAAGHRHL